MKKNQTRHRHPTSDATSLKNKISVPIAEPGAGGEIRSHGNVATSQIALERLLRRHTLNNSAEMRPVRRSRAGNFLTS